MNVFSSSFYVHIDERTKREENTAVQILFCIIHKGIINVLLRAGVATFTYELYVLCAISENA